MAHNVHYYLDTLREKKSSDVSESSLKQYAYSLMWLDKRIEGFDPFDVDTVQDYLAGHKVTRRKASLNALNVWAKCHGNAECCKKLKTPYRSCCDEIAAYRCKQQRSDREEKNWVDYKCINKFTHSLRDEVFAFNKNIRWNKEQLTKAQLAFVLTYHLKYPIRRDLISIQYDVTPAEEGERRNYVDELNHEFVYNDFKTFKHMGRVKHKLTRPMWRLYKLLHKQHSIRGFETNHILVNKHWHKFSKSGFSMWLKTEMKRRCPECEDKSYGCCMLRKCVITHRRKDQWSLDEKACFARDCMHSETQNALYDKRHVAQSS